MEAGDGAPTVRVVGTGLIYGAIVLVWAAFLVPWALRRYDEAAQTRSIERFSSAMRVLGRPNAEEEAEPQPVPAPRPSRAAARVAAKRRRRTLLALLTLTGLVLASGFVSLLPLWLTALPVLLLGAFLIACRCQVRREAEAWWASEAPSPAHPATSATRASGRATRVESAYGGLRTPIGDEPDDEPTVVLSADALVEAQAVAVPVAASDGSSLWDPLPVTLPTYVSKARAPRTIRTIDLDQPGAWTSGHVAGEQTTMPDSHTAAGEKPQQQRAVGT